MLPAHSLPLLLDEQHGPVGCTHIIPEKLCLQDLPVLHLITVARQIRQHSKSPPARPLVRSPHMALVSAPGEACYLQAVCTYERRAAEPEEPVHPEHASGVAVEPHNSDMGAHAE